MRDLTSNPLWPYLKRARNYQKNLGYISAFLLTVALLALLDGLQAQMRGGSREFSLLPGSTMGLAGPSALKNPVDSDLLARFSPPDSPLSFAMEGFFSGYWFGNGMWRGKIIVPDNTPPGGYELIISFKGASAQSAQRYGLSIYANARDA
ncbi:MAG: hypothetical protein K2H64_04385, partial [Desulfovibrio sp.]|nr:hypothetical protein [Desulfovibrio sp.]